MIWSIVSHLDVADLFTGIAAPHPVAVSCAEIPDWTRAHAVRIHFYFPDVAVLPDMEFAERIAEFCAHEMGLGRDVVIHCDEGKNRSVFLAGLVIRALGNHPDLVPFLRTQRPGALTNQTFAGYLAA